MKKKIVAIGASSSKQSINKQLADYVAHQVKGVAVTVLDLNDFEMPIYSVDKEKETGIPDLAQQFKKFIQEADGIVISFAEHNGNFTAAYKNIYDWVSRMGQNVWENTPMLLLATSPGGRGAKSALEIATKAYSRTNEKVVGALSVPSFNSTFSATEGLLDEDLNKELADLLTQFEANL